MSFAIVTLKAFGDFVIACNAAQSVTIPRNAACTERPIVIAGEHVRPLASALGVESDVEFIGSKQWTDVPAAFDVRKRGLFPALHSLIELRARLTQIPREKKFVFDNAGLREFFICSNRKLHHISKESGNIYIAYQEFFQSVPQEEKKKFDKFSLSRHKKITLIPGSRVALKIIPKLLIDSIHRMVEERGYSITVMVLDGENIEFSKNIQSIHIPRRFEDLIATIRDSDFIIAADSLPSHIAEYFNIPQFVFTPNKINFMLPQSAHESHAWTTFDEPQRLANWLDKHL